MGSSIYSDGSRVWNLCREHSDEESKKGNNLPYEARENTEQALLPELYKGVVSTEIPEKVVRVYVKTNCTHSAEGPSHVSLYFCRSTQVIPDSLYK